MSGKRRLTSVVSTTRHQNFLGGVAAEGRELAVDEDCHGAAFDAVRFYFALAADGEAGFGEESEELRRLVEHSREAELFAARAFRQAAADRFGQRAVGAGDWVAVRVDAGEAEEGVDLVDEQVAHRVFHVLRLFVNLVPRELERRREEQLDQPMAAHHAQRERGTLGREPSPFIRRVGGEPALAESLEHARDGAGRDVERFGNRAGRRRPLAGEAADLQDRLQIVFDGQAGQSRFRVRGSGFGVGRQLSVVRCQLSDFSITATDY